MLNYKHLFQYKKNNGIQKKLGVKKKLFVSTNRPTLNFFWCLLMILDEKYDFQYEKDMFHALTYLS